MTDRIEVGLEELARCGHIARGVRGICESPSAPAARAHATAIKAGARASRADRTARSDMGREKLLLITPCHAVSRGC